MNTPKPPKTWTPAERTLWLAKHGAPKNMRLVTDLELAVINNGLRGVQQRVKELEAERQQKERDARIAAEAAEKARVEAEQKAARDARYAARKERGKKR
jgi:hypothetical protein